MEELKNKPKTISYLACSDLPSSVRKETNKSFSEFMREAITQFDSDLMRIEQTIDLDVQSGKRMVTISLGEKLVRMIDSRVESGLFNNRNEFIRCAMYTHLSRMLGFVDFGGDMSGKVWELSCLEERSLSQPKEHI